MQLKTIPEQLTQIYYDYENWHNKKMLYPDALYYHKSRYDKGYIHTYEENGEVLGYWERYFVDDKCFLYNVWIKDTKRKGKVFKELYRHFFNTMPDNIRYIVGEKVKLGGKYQKVRMIRRRCYGKR